MSLLIGCIVALVVGGFSLTNLWRAFDGRSFDLMSTYDPPKIAAENDAGIVVVGIDEASFARHGGWPWSRAVHAALIDKLRRAGAKVIAFDLIFAEAGSDPDADARLAAALNTDNVLAADLAQTDDGYAGGRAVVTPLDDFLEKDSGVGMVTVPRDKDGVLRRLPVHSGASRTTGERATDGSNRKIRKPIQTFASEVLWRSGIDPQLERIPDGALIQALPPHRRVSYYQVVDAAGQPDIQQLPPGLFAGKIVLVGLALNSSVDIEHRQLDSFATSWTARTGFTVPGVEVHATIIDNLRYGLYITPATLPMSLVLLGVIALLAAFLLGRMGVIRALLIAIFGALLLGFGCYAALHYGRFWLPPAAPIAALLLTVIARTGHGFLQERAERRWITTAFGQYLSPALVARLAADPGQLRLGGETRELSILFCDIRGFTTISEGMKDDPQRLTRLINRVLNSLTEAIIAQGGYIDKYIGDCVMALWNAPVDEPEHAVKALRAAQRMLAAIDELNLDLQMEARQEARPWPEVRIGIGINTGACVVGNVGAEKRFNYSALGDAVNLASRLESATKDCGVDLVIGEITAARIGTRIPLREIGVIHVKGKTEEVRVFTLASPETTLEPHF